jgi:hypothetical protein
MEAAQQLMLVVCGTESAVQDFLLVLYLYFCRFYSRYHSTSLFKVHVYLDISLINRTDGRNLAQSYTFTYAVATLDRKERYIYIVCMQSN